MNKPIVKSRLEELIKGYLSLKKLKDEADAHLKSIRTHNNQTAPMTYLHGVGGPVTQALEHYNLRELDLLKQIAVTFVDENRLMPAILAGWRPPTPKLPLSPPQQAEEGNEL
jgi:hypothetical protein